MSLVHAGRVALRAVKKHTVGQTHAESRVLAATENSPKNGSPFVPLSSRHEIAELSWDEDAFPKIVDILKQRLSEKVKWRKVVKALSVLHYCLQEGSGRFTVWCQMNFNLLEGLESFDYILEDNRDRGIEVRRWARKVLSLLNDPQFLNMRSYAEGARLNRTKTQLHREDTRGALRRRGAFFGSRRAGRSDLNELSVSSFEDVAPVTIRQMVMNAISGATVSLESAMVDIRDIARRTSCPADFLEIMEAILDSLLSNDQDRDWGHVFKALVLLRQCLSNVSEDVAAHFEGNPRVMRLLRGFQDMGDVDLLGESAAIRSSLQTARTPDVTAGGKVDEPPAEPVVRMPEEPSVRPTTKSARDLPTYSILNADADISQPFVPTHLSAWDEKRHLDNSLGTPQVSSTVNSSTPQRPLPRPPPDWSRLHTAMAREGSTPPSIHLPSEKAALSHAWVLRDMPANGRALPSPPHVELVRMPSLERPPVYTIEGPTDLSFDIEPPQYASPTVSNADEIEYEFSEEDDSTRILSLNRSEAEIESDLNSSLAPNASSSGGLLFAEEVAEDGAPTSQPCEILLPETRSGSPISQGSAISTHLSPALLPETDSPLTLEASPDAAWLGGPIPDLHLVMPHAPTSTMTRSKSIGSRQCLTGLLNRSEETVMARGGYSDVLKGVLETPCGQTEDVAIKVLRAVKMKAGSNLTPAQRMQRRMNREMDIWGGLSHPHIVPLRGYAIEDDGTPELISPWFEHGDVLSYLEKFPSADRRKIVCQVADGLSYLPAQIPSPIVHGDLKGGNVLIDRDGDGALCDFGLSKLLQDCPSSSKFTTSNAGVGTLRWCAPELLSSDEPQKTLASDVWAFAFLVLEILTGKIPYPKSTNDVTVLKNIIAGVTPSKEDYSEIAPEDPIWELLEECWSIEPVTRPSMDVVCQRLAHIFRFNS